MVQKFRDRTAPKSAKFEFVGTTIEGTVLGLADAPVPEFENGRPVGYKRNIDGSPFTQLDVTIEQDNGIKVVLHTGGAMFDAIADALDEAGISDLVSGHKLSVTYSGNGPKPENSDYPPKEYTATVAAAVSGSTK